MGKVLNDNRMVYVLQFFRKHQEVIVSTLATKLNVSERTVRNDIKQLNQELKKCAVIEGTRGKYSLKVFDVKHFQEICIELTKEDDFLNSSRNRMDYVFAKLIRSQEPMLTDELAYEMNIGRTTLVSDIKKLRAELASYQLDIIGKTSKGLILHGKECDIRRYILDMNYHQIYDKYPLDIEIKKIMSESFQRFGWEKNLRESFERYLTVMLDRFLTGHEIRQLPADFYNLTSHPAFKKVDELIQRIEDELHVTFPSEERLFTMLPIVGMRTPTDMEHLAKIPLDASTTELLEKILQEIKRKMNVTIQSGDFTEEFLYHLMFMMNRLKFHVYLVNPMLEDIKQKYPLAYQMATIAVDVIAREYQLIVTPDEHGYLASYFAVFLAEHDLNQQEKSRIAIVCGTGRVTARLIAVQLKKALDSSTELDLFAGETVSDELLKNYDVVLSTVTLPFVCSRPVIQINEIFDADAVVKKIEKAKHWSQGEGQMIENSCYVMTELLDESRFFSLDSTMSYEAAIAYMVEPLVAQGQLDSGFLRRLKNREKQGTMVFGHSVAIPHGVQYSSNKIVLSIGCCEEPIQYEGKEIQVIFLIGLPEKMENEEGILIRMYDEMIRITQDNKMLQKIAKADSYQSLIRILY